jgi:hypothetical protein
MLARQARELENQQSSDGSKEETLSRLGEGRPCPTSPAMACLKCMLTIPPCLCSGETQRTDPAEGG